MSDYYSQWGLFDSNRNNMLLYSADYVSMIFHKYFKHPLTDVHCSLYIYNTMDVLDGILIKDISFQYVLKSLKEQVLFLKGHNWEDDEKMLECINIVLKKCKSWDDLFSLPNTALNGTDLWHFYCPGGYSDYFLLVPWMNMSDVEGYIDGLDLLRRISSFENRKNDYRIFDFDTLFIREFDDDDIIEHNDICFLRKE